MTIIIKYILIYISIILGSISFTTIFNKRIEKTIALDIFVKIIILYIFGIIGQLKIGTYVVLYLPIIIAIFILIKKRKEKEVIINNVFTIGLGFFSIIYFSFAITTFAKVSNMWDEYSYWSLASKNMFYHDSLLNYEGMKMNILYPPVPTIWQYFFTRTIGTYTQGIEIFASQILSFSMLLPLLEKVKKESKAVVKGCISIIVLCLPCIFTFFYESIYVDALLGIIAGYIFIQMYKESNNKFSSICIGCAFCLLALTKATGFYISLILIAVMILQKIIEKCCKIKAEKEKLKVKENLKLNSKIKELIKDEKQTILTIFIFVCIIIISFISWQYVIKDVKMEYTVLKVGSIDNSRPISEGIKSIFTTIFGSSEKSINLDTSNRTLLNYLYELEVFELPLGISVMTYIFIVILLNIWMYKKIINKEDKNKFLAYIIAVKIGLILYTLFLQFAYLTKFATVEMLKHASVERYLSSYFLAELILMVLIFFEYCDRDILKQKIRYIIVTLVILSITPIYSITNATIFFGSYNIQEMLKIYEIEDVAIKLKETLPEKSKIYVVHQDCDQDCDLWKLKYFIAPEIDIDITEKINMILNEKYKRLGRSLKAEWIEILKNNYEYLYIIDTDRQFENFASDVFISEIEANTLYKINKLEDDTIQLEKVELEGEKVK